VEAGPPTRRTTHVARYATSVTWFVFAALLLTVSARPGRAEEGTDWLTGVAFDRQLQAQEGVSWSGTPLRRALTNFSKAHRVAVVLDRRVDPDQTIDFSTTGSPVGQTVRQVAAELGLGVAQVGPLLYVGPVDTTRKLATLVELRKEDTRALSSAVRRRLLRVKPWQWPMLTAPRQLIDELATESGIRFYRYEEQIPHDLWPAGDLPPLGFAERVSLLAAGFGLTFEFSPDATAIRFIPIPEEVALTRRYQPGGSVERLATQFAERFPNSTIRAAGGELEVVGLWEDHDQIDRILRGETVRRPPPAGHRPAGRGETTVYTVNDTTAPAGAILKQLAPRLGLKLWVDPRAAARAQQRVRVDVQNVPRDELLQAVLGPIGLTFAINGDRLEVRPGP
jgi:hypothetical protein